MRNEPTTASPPSSTRIPIVPTIATAITSTATTTTFLFKCESKPSNYNFFILLLYSICAESTKHDIPIKTNWVLTVPHSNTYYNHIIVIIRIIRSSSYDTTANATIGNHNHNISISNKHSSWAHTNERGRHDVPIN